LVIKKGNDTKNNQSTATIEMAVQFGKQIGELKKDLMAVKEENAELKDGMAKMIKAFDGLKEKIEKIEEENGKLREKYGELEEQMRQKKVKII